MGRTTIGLIAAFLILGIVGVGAFSAQVLQHLRSRAPLPTRKNATIRALWTMLGSALMLAILKTESADSDTLVCAGSIFVGASCVTLLAGYLIERQYNQSIRKQDDGHSAD